ncbi:hypothetical protein [Streptomyces sp. NBC_01614]|uniref:Uncharacterized protein n=1 Tax=Streptomyces sp. NBC_00180 TaxID=2903632 RepID=A0AAU1I0L8_9ACTN
MADPHAFAERVVLFPLGEGGLRSPAAGPLPGYLPATYVPGRSLPATAGLAVAAVGVAVSLAVRPPGTVVAAADRSALGLGPAMCLIPATRFGYLVHPLVPAAWFRRTEPVTAAHGAARLVGGRPWAWVVRLFRCGVSAIPCDA